MPFFLADMPISYIGMLFLAGAALLFLIEKLFLPNRTAHTKSRRIGKGVFRILFLSVYSLACAGFCYENGIRQERENSLQWAQKIAFNRDTAAENRFAGHLSASTDLSFSEDIACNHLSDIHRDSLSLFLQKNLFSPSFPEYRYFFTFCEPEEELLVEKEPEDCRFFFDQKAQTGTPTDVEGLTAMDYGVEYYAYLYRTWLVVGEDSLLANVELGRKKFSDRPCGEGLRLPSFYSYAFYSQNNLWSHNGSFIYPLSLAKFRHDSLYFITRHHFSHLIYPLPDQRFLIVSTPETNPTDLLYCFSFFFLLFGLSGFVILAIFDKNFLGTAGTYARQLRIGIFMLILFVFAVFGIAGIVFIRQINQNENLKVLRQQSLAILAEMENRYGDMHADSLWNSSDSDSIQEVLRNDVQHLAELFRNDIYLYSPAGKLAAGSSGQRIISDSLEQHIIARMLEEQSHLTIERRKLEEGSSAWVAFAPLRNEYNEITGFFCIPYYMRTDEQRSGMNRFLGTYLNIAVLFSLLTFIITSLLARRITRPLSLVTGMVARIRLTHKNEHLSWKRNDEIGGLIRQYNTLVDELESSSRKLAESERENAWSEMARQIAHEIKNPLTPMKLQVQQLQRAYKDGKEDFSERLDKFTVLLTEQIDRLAEIAGTFSKFSQWQRPQLQSVSAAQIILNTVNLFKASETIEFRTRIPDEGKSWKVEADPGFAGQILINLVRNAVQALEEMPPNAEKSFVCLGLEKSTEKEILIYVSDNGPGIAPQKLERIFEPHFTTRSTGSGLGLAICRRLAESMHGSLHVESQPGKGACFRLRLKASKEQA